MSEAPQRRGAPIRSISAVLPAYNEAINLIPVVEATIEALNDAVPEFEVIIIDDGSRDTTARLAEELARQHPEVRLIRHAKHQGYGAAWRSGIAAAGKQYILFMDADRQYDPAEIQQLIQWNDRYDIVAGYRLRRNDPFYRLVIGSCFALLVRLLFDVKRRDVNCGFKLLRASLLKGLTLQSTGALIHAEIHYRAQQQEASLREVGVHHAPRKAGRQSGASPGAMLHAAIELVALRRQIHRERQELRAREAPTTAAPPTGAEEKAKREGA